MAKQSTDSIYLDNLTFDKKLKRGLMYALIRNTRFIVLAILALVLAGVYSFVSIPREVNPEVNIPIVSVITTLPGASPVDVERLVTIEVENELADLADVSRISSSSQNSVSAVTLEFASSVDVDKTVQRVRDALTGIDLPDDASDPRAEALDFNEQPVLTAAIYGETDLRSLGLIAEDIKDALEATPGISKVRLQGQETEEIVVQMKPEMLSRYNLSANQILGALAQSNVTIPGGSVEINELSYSLSVNNEFGDIASIRSLPISLGGNTIPLSEIADVFFRAKSTNDLVYRRLSNGSRVPAINILIYKAANETISGIVEASETVMQQEVAKYPGIDTISVLDLAEETDQSFADLISNFQTTILLVLIILMLFLGLKQALIASLSVPLTFLSAFIIMNITGISFNFLSLFSLLIALGMVVDDAIVIVQANTSYGRRFGPQETALLVFRDFVVPIWTTTLTTIWAFVPLLLASGIIGQFIRSIPVVVTATLLSSTTIAVFINLPLAATLSNLEIPKRVKVLIGFIGYLLLLAIVLLSVQGSSIAPLVAIVYTILFLAVTRWYRTFVPAKGKRGALSSRLPTSLQNIPIRRIINEGLIDFQPIQARYQQLLLAILPHKKSRRRVYAAVGIFLFLSFLFAVTGLLKTEFFPKTDANNMYINVRTPAGSTRATTDRILATIEADVVELVPELDTLTSQTGQNFDSNGGSSSGANRGQLSLVLVDEEDRERSSTQIADALRARLDNYLEADVSVLELSGGPPAGADFQANIKGSHMTVLETIANDFMAMLEEVPGAINIDSSLTLSPGEIRVNLLPEELQKRGLSAAYVGSWLRTAITGTEATSVTIADNDTDITVELADTYTSMSHLQNLLIPGTTESFTLSEVAEFTLEISPLSIVREDNERVVRVTAGADDIPVPQLFAAFEEKASDYELPVGYTWDVGGANEENNESVQSIIQAMGVSAILILITMVLQLNSFRKAALVLAVIPLAVAGVFFNFLLFGIELSFPALIGVLALFGIVVNNAIMLTEKINQNINQGFPFYEAIADACASRLEPILLTSLTTTAGLLPITISDPLWRGLGGAIIAGLSVSGILILVVLPTLFVEVYGNEKAR